MNKEKLKEVFSDKQFVDSLLQMETPQQVQQALKEKGVDFTIEEIEQARDVLIRYANGQLSEKEQAMIDVFQKDEGELSESDLENVSGGFIFVLSVLLAGGYGVMAAVAAWGGIVGGTVAAGVVATEVGTRGRW